MKSKIKKILISIQVFFTGITSKVFATSISELNSHGIQTEYGIEIAPMYGIEESPIEEGLRLGKIILPVLLFIIGLFVIFSKKLTKKVKAIIISALILLVILGYLLMNYIW